MRNPDDLFANLGRSDFRRRFRLNARDHAYFEAKGLAVILDHAAEFIEKRLAPAEPENDGEQTPMRGHPAFVAQHATATCCRGSLARWHDIPKNRELIREERDHVRAVLARWLLENMRGSVE